MSAGKFNLQSQLYMLHCRELMQCKQPEWTSSRGVSASLQITQEWWGVKLL
jgi:hypothetical protein